MKSRRVDVSIKYNNLDISKDITPYIKSISYRDAMSGQADDLQIVLEDRTGLWQGGWMPDKGAKLDVTITAKAWRSFNGMSETLYLNSFEIDEITSSGYPSEVNIKAVSVPYSNTLRGEGHTRSWEKAKLEAIANDIASASKLKLFYDTEDNPVLERVEQTESSDLAFLYSLCVDHGLALKVSDGQLIIFDEAKYEAAPPILVIKKPEAGSAESNVLSYDLSSKIRDVYAACHVLYQKGKDKGTIETTYKVPGKTGKTLQIREQVETLAEAERLAKKRLRDKNKGETVGSLKLIGNVNLAAGLVVLLKGFGYYDGNYIIVEASHDVGGGYVTSLAIRRCLNGY